MTRKPPNDTDTPATAKPRPGKTVPEDMALWDTVTKSVTPLPAQTKKPRKPVRGASIPAVAAPVKTGKAVAGKPATGLESTVKAARPPAHASVFSPRLKPVAPQAERSLPKTTAPLDRPRQRSIKKGSTPIDGRIDLHGMTQAEAHQALSRFLRRHAGLGSRCILVITGKGSRGDGSGGVLRRNAPEWVRDILGRGLLSLGEALPQHGGGGAFYVMLRRSKS